MIGPVAPTLETGRRAAVTVALLGATSLVACSSDESAGLRGKASLPGALAAAEPFTDSFSMHTPENVPRMARTGWRFGPMANASRPVAREARGVETSERFVFVTGVCRIDSVRFTFGDGTLVTDGYIAGNAPWPDDPSKRSALDLLPPLFPPNEMGCRRIRG